MNSIIEQDREMLRRIPKEKLLDLFFMHIRNMWRVDGLYFLGIEEKFGTEAATQIDVNCWNVMGKLEARELKKLLNIEKNDIPTMMYALKNTSYSLYQEEKEIEASPTKAVYRVTKCRVQEARIHKGLSVFPCKNVRFSYLKSFAEEFNPNIQVTCRICPPGERPANVWCEWGFRLNKKA